MRIAALSTFVHYWSHLHPIVDVLRDRGHEVDDLTTWRNSPWATFIHPKDILAVKPDMWIVAGKTDADHVAPQPCVYVEHGAGQSYESDDRTRSHPSYSTGIIPNAALYLCPNFFVQARRQRVHPEAAAVVVGSPRLDQYPIGKHAGVDYSTVAFAFHWNAELIPETMGVLDLFLPHATTIALRLRRAGFLPVAHAHPRIAKRARWHLERHGFEWWDVDDVMTKAAVLVADNTSLLYEFAHVDRPIVVMNHPEYRRHVHHGLRFWEFIPGEQVDDIENVVDAVLRAAREDPAVDARRRCATLTFPVQDGHAAYRAAAMVEQVAADR